MDTIKLLKYETNNTVSRLDPSSFANLITGKAIKGVSWQMQLQYVEVELADRSRLRFTNLADGAAIAYVPADKS